MALLHGLGNAITCGEGWRQFAVLEKPMHLEVQGRHEQRPKPNLRTLDTNTDFPLA
jgi:hypothetical protein